MLRLSLLFFALLAAPITASAAPQCYNEAKIPAHEFPFSAPACLAEVTGLTDDGASCTQVPFLNGEPIVRQKLNAPLGKLYEAYAKAVEQKNGAAARKLFAYARPTPRTFPQWLWLYNEPQAAPMPWGSEMMAAIIKLLAPKMDGIKYIISYDNNGLPVINLKRAWPVLYLLMGGEILPRDEWVPCASGGHEIQRLYAWRYPCFALDSRKDGGRHMLRIK